MQPWAGAGWGHQFIPRVGMEVVVTFEGGDPDKPLVLGSVYNGTHPSPFPLPANKTRSGWKTQSSPGGGGYNELSFEDAVGREQILHPRPTQPRRGGGEEPHAPRPERRVPPGPRAVAWTRSKRTSPSRSKATTRPPWRKPPRDRRRQQRPARLRDAGHPYRGKRASRRQEERQPELLRRHHDARHGVHDDDRRQGGCQALLADPRRGNRKAVELRCDRGELRARAHAAGGEELDPHHEREDRDPVARGDREGQGRRDVGRRRRAEDLVEGRRAGAGREEAGAEEQGRRVALAAEGGEGGREPRSSSIRPRTRRIRRRRIPIRRPRSRSRTRRASRSPTSGSSSPWRTGARSAA